MNKTILIFLTFFVSSTLVSAQSTSYNSGLCKLFQNKAARYKKTMGDDAHSKKTLLSYEKRAKIYCAK